MPIRKKDPSEMDLVDRLDSLNEPDDSDPDAIEFMMSERSHADYNYDDCILPDIKRVLAKSKYTYYEAIRRFCEIAEKQDLKLYRVTETARHYVFECFPAAKGANE